MKTYQIILLTDSFIILMVSLIHFYWGMGGQWGVKAVIPTKRNATLAFDPPQSLTFLVALAFLIMSLILFVFANNWADGFLQKILKYLSYAIGLVFFARSIGDFKFFGFFRKYNNTLFSYWDSWLFTPLTLIVGLSIMLGIWFR
ncbi:MAG: DUF3995 domain-containing protein [Cytophagaceae bacterium]|nr:DUF3995 domain-containing protein [Cytophagaceae bacterium]